MFTRFACLLAVLLVAPQLVAPCGAREPGERRFLNDGVTEYPPLAVITRLSNDRSAPVDVVVPGQGLAGRYKVCVHLLQTGQYDECITRINQLIAEKPRNEFYQLLGTAYYRKHDLHSAEATFRRGISGDAHCWYLWAGLARVLYELGRVDESAKTIAHANQLKNEVEQGTVLANFSKNSDSNERQTVTESPNPSAPEAASRPLPEPSGQTAISDRTAPPPSPVAARSNEPVSAGGALSGISGAAIAAALQQQSANAGAPSNNASNDASEDKEPLAEPEPAATTAPHEFPGKGDYKKWVQACKLYNVGIQLLHRHKYQEAAAKFQAAVDLYDFDGDFYHNLGLAHSKLHRYSAAEQAYRRAIELRANDWDDWCNLASVLFDQNRFGECREALANAARCSPTSYGQNHIDWFLEQLARKEKEEKDASAMN
jgi:tetratricopeptide (TPR) repeat protein